MIRRTTAFLIAAALLPLAITARAYEVSDQFQINTLIEVEAFDTGDAEGDFSGQDASDIELATVEVGLDAQPADRLSGHVLLLYEEAEGDNVVLDEATVTLALTDTLAFTAGKEYVPFGRFETLETMVAVAVGYQLTEQVSLALEVNAKEDYSAGEGGTGEDSGTILAQLAVEF